MRGPATTVFRADLEIGRFAVAAPSR